MIVVQFTVGELIYYYLRTHQRTGSVGLAQTAVWLVPEAVFTFSDKGLSLDTLQLWMPKVKKVKFVLIFLQN